MYTFRIKQRDRSKILLAFHLLIALIFILDLSHVHEYGKRDWIFSAVYLIACIFLFAVVIFHRKLLKTLSKHLTLLLFESVLVLFGAIYFWAKGASLVAVSHGILAGVIILFWIYLKKREFGETIIITKASIILPGLAGNRVLEWGELVNVIKKYDLLTIDFKNNKLIQVEVISTVPTDEDQFNQFCRQQLGLKNK